MPLPNVWLGTSIEDRAALLERAGHLRKTPAAVRFFSCEPLVGDLGQVVLNDIDWVICGGESGPNAREMKAAWARSCATSAPPPACRSSSSNGANSPRRATATAPT
jgi:protein gp37